MTLSNEIPPPPKARDYLQAASVMDEAFGHSQSVVAAIVDQLNHVPLHQSRQYLSHARTWGHAIHAASTTDRSPVIDDRLIQGAFVHGSAAGLALAEHVHRGVATGSSMVKAFDELPFAPSTSDADEYARQIATELEELSDLGLMAMGRETAHVVRRWEALYAAAEKKRLMFRRGIGMAAFLACRVHAKLFNDQERARLEAHAAEIETETFDWDAALRGLTPEV